MINAQSLVYQQLASVPALASTLDAFGAAPAIFSVPVPHNYTVSALPSVLIDVPISAEDDDTYTEEYRVIDIRIRVYQKPDPKNGGTAKLDLAASQVRNALKFWPKGAVEGGQFISATVSGPVDAPTSDPTNSGRLVSARLFFKEI